MSTAGEDPRQAMFERMGLEPSLVKDTLLSKKLSGILETIARDAKVDATGCARSAGVLLYALANKMPPGSTDMAKTNITDLYAAILDGRIKTNAQLTAAMAYFKKKTPFNVTEFDSECGVGVVVTQEQVDAMIAKVLDESKDELATNRYRATGKLLGKITAELKWAEGGPLKTAFDAAVIARIGEKTAADNAPPKAAAEVKDASTKAKPEGTVKVRSPTGPGSSSAAAAAAGGAAAAASEGEGEGDMFEIPPETFLQGRDLEWAHNTEAETASMMKATGGRVITRFPPEPNGYLHIGHAKAMMQNFGVAERFNGYCIMRFDDTNPEAEEKEYIDNILENLTFLGHKPKCVNYSSDYFETLYELAVKLIKKGKAFVCHQTADQIKADREVGQKTGTVRASPYRDRSIEENLRLFSDMRKGKLEENAATLRMRGDLSSPNPNMWDTVFYRIRYSPHPHVGDKWCIYPTYDYTHCIIDSLEFITYSMCTLEFEIRRESYFWLLNELELYKPRVWEYSRLNITHNVLSKRRLRSLVEEGHVADWDDPRLYTINGLRRRGYTADAINKFIKSVGVTRNANVIPCERLENAARDTLMPTSPRHMVVVNPLKIVLTNYPADKTELVKVIDLIEGESPTHDVTLTNVIYVEQEDFQEVPAKDFFRLSKGRTAYLRWAYNITITEVHKDAAGNVSHLDATVDFTNAFKPKAKVHWVAAPAPGATPAQVELRLYDKLFKSEEPMKVEGDWRSDLNPKSLVVKHGYADQSLLSASSKAGIAFQFERVGFFVSDPDSDVAAGKYVFNRTCELKSSK